METEGSLPHSQVPATCPYPKVSVQVQGFVCEYFVTRYVLMGRSCQHLAQTQSWRTTLVGCPRLLIQYIRSCPPYWRPFLHPQPEDAPCRGDREHKCYYYL